MNHPPQLLKQIIEGALLAAGEALSLDRLGELFEEHERPQRRQLRQAVQALQEDCSERGFELVEVASGYRFQVRQSLSPWVSRLWQEKPQRYSRALLETLALIAYRQPITRGDIEDIRGVSVSSNIIRTLQEREWIRVVGHRDVPGRPAMYATTRRFLDYFNLKTLDELPSLLEVRDLAQIESELHGEAEAETPPLATVPDVESAPADGASSDPHEMTESPDEAENVHETEAMTREGDTAPEQETDLSEDAELDNFPAAELDTLMEEVEPDKPEAAEAESLSVTEAGTDNERKTGNQEAGSAEDGADDNWFPPSLTFSDLAAKLDQRDNNADQASKRENEDSEAPERQDQDKDS